MFQFDFQIDPNESQFREAFTRFGNGLSDYSGLWPDLIADFEALEKKQFDSEGATGSGGWPELSKAYKEWKDEHFPGKKILDRTGALNAALTTYSAPGSLRIPLPDSLVVGVNPRVIKYGIYHQSKEPRKLNKDGKPQLPRRPPIQLSEADQKRWRAIIRVFLLNMTDRTLVKQEFRLAKWREGQLNKEFNRKIA